QPRVGEELRGLGALEELFDLLRAVFRRLERADLLGLGETAQDIERRAAEKLVVVRGRTGLDAVLFPVFFKIPVDGVRGELLREGGQGDENRQGDQSHGGRSSSGECTARCGRWFRGLTD